jgi:hypothetical protein
MYFNSNPKGTVVTDMVNFMYYGVEFEKATSKKSLTSSW